MMISVFDRVENAVRKGENAGDQHFLLFPLCFPKPTKLLGKDLTVCHAVLTFHEPEEEDF